MPYSRSRSRYILLSLWVLMFSSSSQFFIMSPILSQIGLQLDIPEAVRGTLISAYAITLGIVALITGPISDRVGRRKILLIGSGAMAISLGLHQFAFDYYSMLAVRIASGFAGGILTGSCVAYIGDYFPKERRGWANGVIATGSAVGQIVAIPIGTVMAGEFGFHSPFLLFSVVMVMAFFLILIKVPQPAVQLADCRIAPKNMISGYLDLLQHKGVRSIAAGYFLMFLSITVFIVYFPTWLENEYYMTTYEIALLFFIGGLATILTGPLSGKISDRTGRKQIIIIANLLLAIVMPLALFFLSLSCSLTYLLFFVIMLLMVARMVPFQALASETLHDKTRGRLMSLTIAIGQLGMAMGSAISGILYTELGFLGNALIGAFACILMAYFIGRLITTPLVAIGEESSAAKARAIE